MLLSTQSFIIVDRIVDRVHGVFLGGRQSTARPEGAATPAPEFDRPES